MVVENEVQAATNSPMNCPAGVVRTISRFAAFPMMQTFGSVTSSTVQRSVKLPAMDTGGPGGGGGGPASVLASKKHPEVPNARQAPANRTAQRACEVLIPIELMRLLPALAPASPARCKASFTHRTRTASSED